ncbi:MAG: hypothetical protein ACREOZ_05320, partial [Gloeomargaritales cyanobacterium]
MILPDSMKDFIYAKSLQGMTANPITVDLKANFRDTIHAGILDSITLKMVQNLIKNHSRGIPAHMTIMAVSDVVKGTEYKATLGNFQGFTFGYDMDGNRNPILGRGEDADPFILCFSSKAWVRQLIKAVQAVAAVDGAIFMLHMDGSFNLNLMGYPVIVVGVSDSSRN